MVRHRKELDHLLRNRFYEKHFNIKMTQFLSKLQFKKCLNQLEK